MRVRLTAEAEAEADIVQARSWYADRVETLGEEFEAALDVAIQQLEAFSESAPLVHASIRRTLLHRFPYCIFYSIEEDEVVVLGCFHARRHPESWRLRAQRASD